MVTPCSSMAARKRKRVPAVLWRLFGNRARTLADTILALIPPAADTQAACPCERRGCLACSGDEAMSFLVRSGDSLDYRKLLDGCFVVVSEDAPPFPLLDPRCRWSQLEIVRRSIEVMLRRQPSNLICCSYDKERRSSAVVDELTSSKWTVLLRRVGDSLMLYLLRYTSIFLPLPGKKHLQISGRSIGDLCSKFSGCMPKSRSQHHPLALRGNEIKRKRVDGDEISRKQQCTYTLGLEPSSTSTSVATGNGEDESNYCTNGQDLQGKKLLKYFIVLSGSTCVSVELPHEQSEGSSKQNTVISQKRTRQYQWQRLRRKRRQLAPQETPSLIPCGGNKPHNISLFSSSSQGDMICAGQKLYRTVEECGSKSKDISRDKNISHCFCCSVFQNEPGMKRNVEIDRKTIFYALESSSSMLPMRHILYTLKPNGPGASILFNNIFEGFGPDKNAWGVPCCHSKNGCSTNSCLYHLLTKLLKNLIRKSQNCRHVRLLEKHCCSRYSYQDTTTGAGTGPEVANAKNGATIRVSTTAQVGSVKCCLKSQIVSFIWAICRRIVPSQLLGEPSNWRILRKNISRFIHLRRFEKFSLKECIHKLKISKFPIFANKHTGCSGVRITDTARHRVFECWMLWLFTHLVSPLIEANFYVTESDHEKQEVLYYRKSTWEKLLREDECMNSDEYCLLNHDSARNILKNRYFGFSRARLRPKHNGFRMLSNLRAVSRFPVNPPSSRIYSNQKSQRKAFGNHRVKYRFFKSVNSVLHDVHVVLKGLCAKKPEQLGSSVFDYNDVYKKLVPFLFHLKNGSTSLPNVFIVVSDVSKAFDSVKHDKLLSVMKDAIFDDEFTLEKFTQVLCTRKSLKIDQQLMLEHKDIVAASTKIKPRFHAQSLGSIVVKKERSRKMRKEEINSILKEHIKQNVVQLGNKFYIQRVGIPQGSVVSSLLCSLYYGHMERNVVFPFLEKCNADTARRCEYLMLRFIDDFLFISTSKKQASMFFTRLDRGVHDYNCFMNTGKYGLNFMMDERHGCQSNRLYISKDGISFLHWSGLLVNCSTLEIQADYTRYLNSHLRSSLTVSRQGKVGQNLKAKLKSYLRPKCHPIFYDSNINSPGVVRLNIYQAFLLCAMKFICHLSNLTILPTFNPNFCIRAIQTSLRYMNRLIKRKMHCFRVDPRFRPKYNVKAKDVMWLGLYAYSRVLQKKQSRYKTLLRMFRCKLNAYGGVEDMSPELKYAVDDMHSSVLWSIKY